MKNILFLMTTFSLSLFVSSQTALINYGSSWKYHDKGNNLGTAWRAVGYNDVSWLSGNAQLGYGDGDEATIVSYGSSASQKYYTTYFRKSFTVSNLSVYSGLSLSIKRDDGAVVYINGIERFRTNMPTGSISYTTKASSEASDDGNTAQTISLATSVLAQGNNIIAVEIHQRSRTSSDISFDLQLTAIGDLIPPLINTFSPADNASGILINSNLVLTFNENVQKGTGNILIKEGGVVTQTIDVTSASVIVSGTTATINHSDFSYNAAVNVEIAAGAFKDLANNNYNGINSATTWNFNVENPDLIAPTVTTYSPADNSTGVLANSNLVLTFSENIQKGTGNILIKEGGVISQTIAVTSATVTVSGNTVTIDPANFSYSAAVNIEITAGAIMDLANNNYTGITNTTTWNFAVEAAPSGPQTLIPFGAVWKYYATGAAPTGTWKNIGYADGAWPAGAGELGYGDGGEVTCIPSGGGGTLCTPTGNKWITTYFRKEITISNPLAFSSIAGRVIRDDGVVIYVNGTEVYRSNMPAGTPGYTTLASSAISGTDETTPLSFSINPNLFSAGNNIVAVEIHQSGASSSDISFDFDLIGNTGAQVPIITRGPYMNSATQSGVTIQWRTDIATNSKVSFGTTPGSLIQSVTDNTITTEHIITLSSLTINTLYYYSIGSSTHVIQGDANNYFKTMPAVGSTQKIRVLAMGDMGNNSTNQINVRKAYQNFNGTNYTDAWILLGDNAYQNGTDEEYQTNFFNIYQESLTKNHVLWPAPGNHDYAGSAARQADHQIPYYDMFTLPSAGQAGGVASGTEAFYSYNYGNVHFVSLDSYGWETGNTRLYDTLGPQVTWLKQDLAANTQPWTVVYFHHPPYSKGSHNSDTDAELINLRGRIVRILERYKVDMVLNGHSHSYERSYLINGHYGVESSFVPATHALSSSSAKYNGTANSCTYIKNGAEVLNGIVYAVVGSAGQLGGTTAGYPHDAMYYSDVTNAGTLFFEVEGNRLDAKWICADGVIRDNFSIMKDVNKTVNLTIPSGTPTQITASWIGNYSWSTGATTRSITVSPSANTSYTVNDGAGCISDIFNINITGNYRNRNMDQAYEILANTSLKVIPTLIHKGQQVMIRSDLTTPTEVILIDAGGKVIQKFRFNQSLYISTERLQSGIYFIRMNNKSKPLIQKIVIID